MFGLALKPPGLCTNTMHFYLKHYDSGFKPIADKLFDIISVSIILSKNVFIIA